MASIDNVTKNKLNSYNLAKGSLQQMRRKQTLVYSWHYLPLLLRSYRGNLSVRSLINVVPKEELVQESEFLETVIVAVPK
jgi:V-type H+-transporting ATPase subunit C